MRVIFRREAVEDIVEAAAWCEARASGLGDQLIDEILDATGRAEKSPELFRVVYRERNIRRVLTDRFPYRIFSRLLTKRSTSTPCFTVRDMIAAGRSDCKGI
jgi:hypothetical protein